MFCKKCGKEFDDSVSFCPACGHKTTNNSIEKPDITFNLLGIAISLVFAGFAIYNFKIIHETKYTALGIFNGLLNGMSPKELNDITAVAWFCLAVGITVAIVSIGSWYKKAKK